MLQKLTKKKLKITKIEEIETWGFNSDEKGVRTKNGRRPIILQQA